MERGGIFISRRYVLTHYDTTTRLDASKHILTMPSSEHIGLSSLGRLSVCSMMPVAGFARLLLSLNSASAHQDVSTDGPVTLGACCGSTIGFLRKTACWARLKDEAAGPIANSLPLNQAFRVLLLRFIRARMGQPANLDAHCALVTKCVCLSLFFQEGGPEFETRKSSALTRWTRNLQRLSLKEAGLAVEFIYSLDGCREARHLPGTEKLYSCTNLEVTEISLVGSFGDMAVGQK